MSRAAHAGLWCDSRYGDGLFFDDRLATVLRQRADSEAGSRTQFRQLLDILGNRKYGGDQSLVAAAWLRMDALAEGIPASERAAMIRERGWRLRNADLAAHLSDFEPEVASAALERADLSDEDWSALVPRLPVRARGFLRLRKDLPQETEILLDRLGVYDRGLPSPGEFCEDASAASLEDTALSLQTDEADFEAPPPLDLAEVMGDSEPLPAVENTNPLAGLTDDLVDEEGDTDTADAEAGEADDADTEPAPTSTSEAGRTEISALRERIAEYRRTRGPDGEGSELSPRLPLQDEPAQRRQVSNFGFAADAAGRIEWAESEVASSVIGTRLIAPRRIGTSGDETAFERAYSRRQPIRRAEVELTGASRIAGIWVVDAQPQFTEDGNFSGYVGRFRKPVSGEGMAYGPSAREADRIRQLLHELRTPVTAIQGYAEVVQQQLFGPAPHEYRAMSASIAADAARILSGFEELDRLARLEAGVAEMEAGASDLADISRKIAAQLAPVLAPRLAGIEIEPPQGDPVVIALANGEAEALIWRVLATFGGGCASGEVLTCALGRKR
ncbi:MAG: histidine kinase dimerization/phospho-acceptor domain-containing protein, partial [Pseudomonadota bacterium]